MVTFSNCGEWRNAITEACDLTLSHAYCRERISALANSNEPSTRVFSETYGEDYLSQICAWFQKAESEAIE